MTKEEFEAGLPFKMSDSTEIQPVYSYVNVGGLKCIQAYTLSNPNPVFHCKVTMITDERINVRIEVLGFDLTRAVPFDLMHRVGDGLPVRTYTRDLMQATVHEDDQGAGKEYKVNIMDLYAGCKLVHLTRSYISLDVADRYARETINYK
jgi:hypothetical protein